MKRKCLICNTEYDPQDSSSFFNFKYCSDECELKAEVEARSAANGVHMYMCISPMQVILFNEKETEIIETVEEGSKWKHDDTQRKGLNAIHLTNLSGRADEKLVWIEIDQQVLTAHFQKI